MNRAILFPFSTVLSILFILASCNSQTNSNADSGEQNKKNPTYTYLEGKDYTEFVRARVMDKVGFSTPVMATVSS